MNFVRCLFVPKWPLGLSARPIASGPLARAYGWRLREPLRALEGSVGVGQLRWPPPPFLLDPVSPNRHPSRGGGPSAQPAERTAPGATSERKVHLVVPSSFRLRGMSPRPALPKGLSGGLAGRTREAEPRRTKGGKGRRPFPDEVPPRAPRGAERPARGRQAPERASRARTALAPARPGGRGPGAHAPQTERRRR